LGRKGLPLAAPALFARWASYSYADDLVSTEVFRRTGILFFGFIVLQLLLFIIRAPRVDSEVLCAGITIYLMLGLFWSLAYSLIDRLALDCFVFNAGPASGRSMQGFQALYFSFITLSTMGYGDIVPVSKLARMLAKNRSNAAQKTGHYSETKRRRNVADFLPLLQQLQPARAGCFSPWALQSSTL